VGGFVVQPKGWAWTIWVLMMISGFALVVLFFFLPETSSTNILYRRAVRLRKLTGNHRLRCEPEIEAVNMTPKDVAMIALVRSFTLNFQEPIVLLLNLYIALVYGILYIWFESFPVVFAGIYNFDLGEVGLAFIGILVGAIITIPPFFAYLYYIQERQFNEAGDIKPEKRLVPAMVGSFFIPICLFWFGWSSRKSISWIMPIIGSSFFSFGTFLLFVSGIVLFFHAILSDPVLF
jgi:DHA1 family multidrug resistance protein-like MFS transporter